MKNIHIQNSYKIWRPSVMDYFILKEHEICITMARGYKKTNASIYSTKWLHKIFRQAIKEVYNRSIYTMYVEWWLHNIGYYLTLPFCWIKKFKSWNERCKHVDLEEWK